MLQFEEKNYDLNFLCSFTFDFQMLKEVLIQLANSNQMLEQKVKQLEESNEEKNNRLSTLEERVNILFIPKENENSHEEIIEEKVEKEEEKKNIEEKKDEKEEKIIKDGKKEMDKEEIENNQTDTKRSIDRRKSLRELEIKQSLIQQVPQVSHETIKSLLKLIRENSEKINKMETNINKKLNMHIKNFENDFINLNSENTKDHKSIIEKIRVINEKLYEYDSKMDGIIIKTAPLDTLSFFRDNGNGNLDATKVMIQVLEEKLNKRMELIEKKNNNDNKEDNLLKNKISELEELINEINEELKKKEQKTDNNLENIINNCNEDIQELKDLINKNYIELIKIKEDLSSKIENSKIKSDNIKEFTNKTKPEKELKITKLDSINKNENISKGIEKNINENKNFGDNSSDLKERINALNNKVNDIEKYFNSLFDNSNQDMVELKKKIEEMNTILLQKITKLDLKALENKTIEQSDELIFLQDKTSELSESIKKLIENNSSFVKRLENLTNDIIRLQNTEVKVVEPEPVDLSGYVEEKALKELLKPINKNLENLFLERRMLSNSIKEINENLLVYETKEKVMKLKEEITEKISNLEKETSKKYTKKFEMNKLIKNLELKLKSIDVQQQNKDGDSWILAKQPVGCFNCASCEANIKNVSPSNEYSIWKKYPLPDRQYIKGQGFSRLLQKINNYNDKNNVDKTEFSNDNELSNSIYFNNVPNIRKSSGHFYFRANSKEPIKDNIIENNSRYNKRYKLPNVSNKGKKIGNIPLTDEEEERSNKSMDSSNNSPKILKIAKKKISDDLLSFKINSKKYQEEHNQLGNSFSIKSYSKLERNQSLQFYGKTSNS